MEILNFESSQYKINLSNKDALIEQLKKQIEELGNSLNDKENEINSHINNKENEIYNTK